MRENSSESFEHVPYRSTDIISSDKSISLRFAFSNHPEARMTDGWLSSNMKTSVETLP